MTRYVETLSDAELASVEVERWEPVASSSRPTNFVAPAPQSPTLPPAIFTPSPVATMDTWRPTHAVIEQATPVERAHAMVIRQLLLWVIWLVLAVAAALVAWKAAALSGGWSAIFGLVLFGALATGGWYAFDVAERADSAVGLEKHRINQAADLERQRLEQDHELKRAALEEYLRQVAA